MSQVTSGPELSFEWAKSASWDQYEQEMGRVVKQAAAVPGMGGGFASGLMDTVSKGWKSMPTWGKGALIGTGVGALGGMLTDDKKKMRGALNGAMLGGGLGAMGGFAYDQMGGGAPASNNTNKTKTPPPAPPAEPGVAEKVTDNALSAGGAVSGNSLLGSAGLMGAGYGLNRLGTRNFQTLGAAPPAKEMFPGAKTITVMPTRAEATAAVRNNVGGAADQALAAMASKQPINPNNPNAVGISNLPTPTGAHDAARLLNDAQRRGASQTPPRLELSNGETMPIHEKAMVKQHMENLRANNPGVNARSPINAAVAPALRFAGRGGQIAGALGVADSVRKAFGSSGPNLANRIGSQPATESGLANLVQYAKGIDPAAVRAHMDTLPGWSDEMKQRALRLLGGAQ